MHKVNLFRSSVDLVSNRFIGFIATILTILIIFNLGWLIMLVKLCTRLSVAANLNKTIFYFDSILLLGNLGILLLFFGYALGIRSLKAVFGKKY